ncbi:hypothetical protein RM190_08645 [Paracoccus sp. CPCC 101403]|uniref:Uncharacterized protein n=1 Tax=Paracoccus broussonetiae TaxID=3075834 RepID=A0ABU3ECG0_9RHOB|nr:hypothetical protein [Paracoccus sp. CPCC 101403]MDT1061921.1 hypothetical protein [Paracoccus sp. CPCC 101403]
MSGTEKAIRSGEEPVQVEAPPVADLSDEEVEAVFEDLVAQIDAEQQTSET